MTLLDRPLPTVRQATAPDQQAGDRAPGRSSSSGLRPKILLLAADAAAVVVAAATTWFLVHHWQLGDRGAAGELWWSTIATVPLWLAIFANQRLYNTRFIGRRLDEFRRIVNAAVLGTILVALAANVTRQLPSRGGLLVLGVSSVTVIAMEREVARRVFLRLRSKGRMVRSVVIAGANPEGRDIAAMLRAEPWLGYEVLGFVDDHADRTDPVPGVALLGCLSDLDAILREHVNASVIVAASAVESAVTNRLARDLLDQGVHVELSSTLRDISSQRLTIRPLGRFPIVYVEPVTRGGWRAWAKRAFDIAGAVAGLVLTAPILTVVAVLVKIDSRGPVLFRQIRVGRNSEPFPVLKIRTMVIDAEEHLAELQEQNEADGPLFKMTHDPRITRIGRFLRMTSLDEVPQLLNVLRGDMSLVGPRPALPHETEEWDSLLTQRLRVKPGITGMWQVSGRSDTSFEDYTRLDLYYVDNWSLVIDLAILAKTIPVVLFRQGAR